MVTNRLKNMFNFYNNINIKLLIGEKVKSEEDVFGPPYK